MFKFFPPPFVLFQQMPCHIQSAQQKSSVVLKQLGLVDESFRRLNEIEFLIMSFEFYKSEGFQMHEHASVFSLV